MSNSLDIWHAARFFGPACSLRLPSPYMNHNSSGRKDHTIFGSFQPWGLYFETYWGCFLAEKSHDRTDRLEGWAKLLVASTVIIGDMYGKLMLRTDMSNHRLLKGGENENIQVLGLLAALKVQGSNAHFVNVLLWKCDHSIGGQDKSF